MRHRLQRIVHQDAVDQAITLGAALQDALLVAVAGVGEPGLREQFVLEVVGVRSSRGLLDHHPEQEVAAVVVGPLGPGRERLRLLAHEVHHPVGGEVELLDVVPRLADRREVGDARRVVQELPQGGLIADLAEAGDVFRERIVELHLALLDEAQDRRRGELLRDRRDAADAVGAHRDVVLEVRDAIPLRVRESALSEHGDRHPGDRLPGHRLGDDRVDLRSVDLPPVVRRVGPGGRRYRHDSRAVQFHRFLGSGIFNEERLLRIHGARREARDRPVARREDHRRRAGPGKRPALVDP